MVRKIILTAMAVVLCGVFSAVAMEERGPDQIKIDGGSRGKVAFPHQRHQDALKDCLKCHDLFPKELGGIKRLKEAGKLAKKQVMTKHCINCHKAMDKAGAKSGPTTCSRCHIKNKK